MTIAVIGWGSLIWDPRGLGLASRWRATGPCLPIEFARKSSDMRVTLVLVPGYESQSQSRSYWAVSCFESLDAAAENLRVREGCKNLRPIHVIDNDGARSFGRGKAPDDDIASAIDEFRGEENLDAVVWTGLCPKSFKPIDGRIQLIDQVLGFLRSLDPEEEARAKEYIQKAPPAISTPVRQAVQEEFDWKLIPLPPSLFDGPHQGESCRDL